MATQDVEPVEIKPGVNFPEEKNLQTGDVLFARVPGTRVEILEADLGSRLTAAQRTMSLENYLGGTLTWLVGKEEGGVAKPPISTTQTSWERELESTHLLSAEASAAVDLSPAKLAFLIAILKVEFPKVFEAWFSLSVEAFLKTKLARLLLTVLSGNIGDGFFVGHCAMVILETDGAHADDGGIYVIEANATDFAHFGVNIRPYHIAGDGSAYGNRYRAWANFRASLGNSVWQSRHPALTHASADEARSIRRKFLQASKTYLGRSYSFFDDPEFSNADRLYCSELIHRIYHDVLIGNNHEAPEPTLHHVDQGVRTWKWMRDNNLESTALGKSVREALQEVDGLIDKDFFILTVQMLWHSPNMKAVFKPLDEPYA